MLSIGLNSYPIRVGGQLTRVSPERIDFDGFHAIIHKLPTICQILCILYIYFNWILYEERKNQNKRKMIQYQNEVHQAFNLYSASGYSFEQQQKKTFSVNIFASNFSISFSVPSFFLLFSQFFRIVFFNTVCDFSCYFTHRL